MLMKRYRPSSYVVRKGTLLYTGTGSRANRKAVRAGGGKTELLYLSPNKEVAEAYRFVVTAEVTKDLMLAHKADVMSLVHKEKKHTMENFPELQITPDIINESFGWDQHARTQTAEDSLQGHYRAEEASQAEFETLMAKGVWSPATWTEVRLMVSCRAGASPG